MSRRYVSSKRRALEMSFVDTGTAERWQHGGREMVLTAHHGVQAARVVEECALDAWLVAGAISVEEHAAGLRLRHDYIEGQVPVLAQRQYHNVQQTAQGPWESRSERRNEGAEQAYRSWRSAIRASGPRASALLVAVCCEDGALAWPRRGELRDALQRLVKHYGM